MVFVDKHYHTVGTVDLVCDPFGVIGIIQRHGNISAALNAEPRSQIFVACDADDSGMNSSFECFVEPCAQTVAVLTELHVIVFNIFFLFILDHKRFMSETFCGIIHQIFQRFYFTHSLIPSMYAISSPTVLLLAACA